MFRRATFIKRYTPSFFQKSDLHYSVLSTLPNKSFIAELKNDHRRDEGEEEYINRSWRDLQSIVVSSSMYIYVDKAVLRGHIYPGHIATFLTNSKQEIIDSSSVSLRNGERVEDKKLIYQFPHDKDKIERISPVWKVKFYSIEDEFKKFMFSRANKGLPVNEDKRRFLISIPITVLNKTEEDLLNMVNEVISKYGGKEYILCPGNVGTEIIQALNCITAFYSSLGVEGIEPNPSPQMAAWSFIKLIQGAADRDTLIEGTGLREMKKERTYDDELTPLMEGNDRNLYKP